MRNVFRRGEILRRAVLNPLLIAFMTLSTSTLLFAQDADFERNANGNSLSTSSGKTLLGITRDTSAPFSIYMSKGNFNIHTSSGTDLVGTYKKRSKNILCIKGLVADKPDSEVCKYAPARGRGMDWQSVNVTDEKDGTTYYDLVVEDEHRGSSQIVYSFDGRLDLERPKAFGDVRNWAGHLIIGRTLKDKEAFFFWLGMDERVDFVFGSGRRVRGSYTIEGGTICFDFDEGDKYDSCRKPRMEKGQLLWARADGGGATSEIVFVKKMEEDGPRPIEVPSQLNAAYMVGSPDGKYLLAISLDKRSASLVSNEVMSRLASFPLTMETWDMRFSSDSNFFALVNETGEMISRSIETGEIVLSREASPDALQRPEIVPLPGGDVIVGYSNGEIWRYYSQDVKEPLKLGTAGADITDLVALEDGRIFVSSAFDGGTLSILKGTQAPSTATTHRVGVFLKNISVTPDGSHILGKTYNDEVVSISLSETDEPEVKRLVVGKGLTFVDIDKYGHAVFGDGKSIVVADPTDLTEKKRWKTKENVFRTVATDIPDVYVVLDRTGDLDFYASSAKQASALANERLTFKSPIRTAVREASRKLAAVSAGEIKSYESLKKQADKAFKDGNCVRYNEIDPNLHPDDRLVDCEKEAARRKEDLRKNQLRNRARSEISKAVNFLECDKANSVFNDVERDAGWEEVDQSAIKTKISDCQIKKKENEDRLTFIAAVDASDCETVKALAVQFGKPDEILRCEMNVALKGKNPRAIFLLASRLDNGGERAAAKELYTVLTTDFIEDDLAITAATRLTALADIEAMEARQAEQAQAIKAAEQRAAAAEAAARKAAEDMKRDTQRKLEAAEAAQRQAERDARDAQRRADEAARLAASQPKRNTRCDHVYVGKEFTRQGRFGITLYYRVLGVSERSGMATIRAQGFSSSDEVDCYDIP